MNPSLRARIFLASISLLLVTFVGLGIPLVMTVRQHSYMQIEELLEEQTMETAGDVGPPLASGDTGAIARISDDAAAMSSGRVTVVDAEGLLVFDTAGEHREGESFANRPEIGQALQGRASVSVRMSETLGTEIMVVTVPSVFESRLVGAVRLLKDMDETRAHQRQAIFGVVLIGVLTALAGALLASITSRTVTAPLGQVAETARRFGEGDLSARAIEEGPPEIVRMASALNEAAARVEAAVATERAFLGNAAHQLRTPITALTLRLDAIADAPNLSSDQRADLRAAIDEAHGLARLLTQLLALARASEPGALLLAKPVDVRPVLDNLAATWSARLAKAGVELHADIATNLPQIRVPPELIAQACDNLLDNIRLYCPGSVIAHFRAAERDGNLLIEVEDAGSGMPQRLGDDAFGRFTRGDSRRPGSGLGLAVVDEVARAGGGSARLETSPGGTLISIEIPGLPQM